MGSLLVFVKGAEERVAGPCLVAGGQVLPQPQTRFSTLEKDASRVSAQLASARPQPRWHSPLGGFWAASIKMNTVPTYVSVSRAIVQMAIHLVTEHKFGLPAPEAGSARPRCRRG